jgi:hypothetical protein
MRQPLSAMVRGQPGSGSSDARGAVAAGVVRTICGFDGAVAADRDVHAATVTSAAARSGRIDNDTLGA